MLRRNGPVVKSVESVLRLEGSLWGERFLEEVGLEAGVKERGSYGWWEWWVDRVRRSGRSMNRKDRDWYIYLLLLMGAYFQKFSNFLKISFVHNFFTHMHNSNVMLYCISFFYEQQILCLPACAMRTSVTVILQQWSDLVQFSESNSRFLAQF